MKKQNKHDNTLPDTAVSLKIGDFNTPPDMLPLKKKEKKIKLSKQREQLS